MVVVMMVMVMVMVIKVAEDMSEDETKIFSNFHEIGGMGVVLLGDLGCGFSKTFQFNQVVGMEARLVHSLLFLVSSAILSSTDPAQVNTITHHSVYTVHSIPPTTGAHTIHQA